MYIRPKEERQVTQDKEKKKKKRNQP